MGNNERTVADIGGQYVEQPRKLLRYVNGEYVLLPAQTPVQENDIVLFY
jgi:hypothetical protein